MIYSIVSRIRIAQSVTAWTGVHMVDGPTPGGGRAQPSLAVCYEHYQALASGQLGVVHMSKAVCVLDSVPSAQQDPWKSRLPCLPQSQVLMGAGIAGSWKSRLPCLPQGQVVMGAWIAGRHPSLFTRSGP